MKHFAAALAVVLAVSPASGQGLSEAAGRISSVMPQPLPAVELVPRVSGRPVIDDEHRALLSTIESHIVADGVSPRAADAARELVEGMLGQADLPVVRGMAGPILIVIIPRGRKMTDIPGFQALRGRRTPDGRRWEDVRGEGDLRLPGGRWVAVAVAEENLTARSGHASGYPARFLFAHEYAHAIETYGLSSAERIEAARVYRETVSRKGGTGLGEYADSNSSEFFAQAVAAYFGLGYLGENAARLRRINPGIWRLCAAIFGPAHSAAPR